MAHSHPLAAYPDHSAATAPSHSQADPLASTSFVSLKLDTTDHQRTMSYPQHDHSPAASPTVVNGAGDDEPVKGPVIWGFPLGEMSFGAFSTKSLMDPKWHLRKERIIFYQLAMLVCLAAECCTTYSLSKYEDLQTHIEDNFPPAHVYQNDLIDLEIVLIVMCVMVACLFGADFFFLAQFPKRRYPWWYQQTKKACAVTITSGVLAAAIGMTIIVSRNAAKIEHVPQYVADAATALYYRPPLEYRKWAVNWAAVGLIWPGWIFCVISTIFMFMAADYDRIHGTAPRGMSGKTAAATGAYPASSSDLSTSGMPLTTPPIASGSTGTLPAGAYREGEKIVLPVPAGRRLSVEQEEREVEGTGGRQRGLSLEMDHGTFEGEGRHPGSVIGRPQV
ncbi:hypothetical protein JCM10207_000481 [Rhodosporidiobolus poonsookiae]